MYQRPSVRNVPDNAVLKRDRPLQGAFGEGLYRNQRYTGRKVGSSTEDYEMQITDTHILFLMVFAAAFLDWIFW